MKLTTKLVTAFCAGILLFAACSKEKKGYVAPPVTKTQKDYLVDGHWQITSFKTVTHYKIDTLGTDSATTEDAVDSLKYCEKDNFMRFMANDKIYADEGAVKCDATDPQVDSADTWSLSSDFAKLLIFEGKNTQSFDIEELTPTNFKMSHKEERNDSLGGPYAIILTISAKNIK
jgi:hypothetical protein